jgi:hypothetical protein
MSDVNRGHTMKYIQNLTELSRLYSEGALWIWFNIIEIHLIILKFYKYPWI